MGDKNVAAQAPAVESRDGAAAPDRAASRSLRPEERALSDVIEIVTILGEPMCAQRILDFYCRDRLARRWLTLPAVTVLRHRAFIAAVTGDPQAALYLLRTLPARADRDRTETGRALLMRGAVRILVGRPGQGTDDLERAAQLFHAHGVIDWCDACLRVLAASRGTGLSGNEDVATLLTGGYWGHQEITAALRRSLTEVEEQLRGLGRASVFAV